MNNNLEANAGKFDLFLSTYEDQTITVENHVMKSSGIEELLQVTIERKFNFKMHLLSLYKKTNCKLHALSRSSKYMTLNKHCILMKSFIISHCPLPNYCPMIWMIHNRGLNNKFNHIHERALHIIYDD